MEINLNLVCRLCAKEDSVCRPIPVFGEEGKKIKIAKKIRLCLPIIITEEDEYPQQICLSCLNKLDTSYELYSGCLGAQKIIKRMLTLLKPAESSKRETIPIEQENPISRKVASLTLDNPMGRVGSTIIKIRERKETQKSAEPRSKVRILSTENLSNNSKGQSTNVERQETDDSNDEDVTVQDDDADDDDGCEDNMDVDFSATNGEEDMEHESQQAIQQEPPCNSSEPNHTVTYSADKSTVPQSSVVFDQLTGNSARKVIQQSERKINLPKPGTGNSFLLKGNSQIVQKNSVQTSSVQSPKVLIPNSLQKQASLLENMLSQRNQTQDKNIIQTPQSKQLQKKALTDVSVPVTVQDHQSKSAGTNNINKSQVQTLRLVNRPIPVVFTTASQDNTSKATELTPGKNLQYSAAVVARTVPEYAGVNPVSGHSIRCKCSRCLQSVPKSNVAAATTATVSNNTTSPVVQTSEMTRISAVMASRPECSQSEDEDDPPIGIISSVTSMAPSESDKMNESATPTDNTSSLTATSATAATDSAGCVAPVATAIANSTNPDTNSDEITIDDNPLNDSSTGRNVESSFCKYCEKYFPADIFIHHRTLHFRSRFFCCVSCGKNFRTEVGLEHHRCDA